MTDLQLLADEMKAFAVANPLDKLTLVKATANLDPRMLKKYQRDVEWTKEDGLPIRKFKLRFQLTMTPECPCRLWSLSFSDMTGQTIPELDVEIFKKLFLGEEGKIFETGSFFNPGKTRIFHKIEGK